MTAATTSSSSAVSAHPQSTIVDMSVTALIAPLEREFHGSHYHMSRRGTVIVSITTSDGVTGEAYVGDEDVALLDIVTLLETDVREKLIGVELMAPQRIWQSIFPVTYSIRRSKRTSLVALSAVDAAVWDAIGRTTGVPLWRLWGGFRDRLPMIAIGGYYGDPLGTIEEEIADYKRLGLAGMKFKVGGAAPDVDAARVAAAREAGGEDFILVIDANQGLSVPAAIDLAKRLDGMGVRWFEEPVHWANDRRGMRDVRYLGGIPVCAGQTEPSVAGCRDLMEEGAIDVCNFDSSWSGGPTSWLRTAAIASAYSVQMGHHEEPQVAAHLLASQAHGTYVECFHPHRDPFWWSLIADERQFVDGQLLLTERSGLGWELDRDYIERYRVYPE